jgi:hypothetical protein
MGGVEWDSVRKVRQFFTTWVKSARLITISHVPTGNSHIKPGGLEAGPIPDPSPLYLGKRKGVAAYSLAPQRVYESVGPYSKERSHVSALQIHFRLVTNV